MLCDVPDGLRLFSRHLFHLVLTRIGIVSQMADIGDIDDVGELVTLPTQRTAQHVGKDIGAHIADMRIVVDRGAAGVHARLTRMDGLEGLQLAGQAVE